MSSKASRLLDEVKNPSSGLGTSLKNATFWNIKNTEEGLIIDLTVYGAPVFKIKQVDEGFIVDNQSVEILLKELSNRIGKG